MDDGGRRRWLALTVLCAAMMMIILDGTIVTVALPAIQRDLGFSPAGLAWTVNAYLIAFGGLLLLAGRLGDLVGGKRVFMAGVVVFTAASVLCGLSASQPMLIVARFAQGAGGALASAVSLGMIVRLFPRPPEQAKAMGAYSFVGAGGASVGLAVGGVLTQALSWHWIFFVNAPIGVAAALAGWRLLEPDRGIGLRAGADAAGAVLVTAGLMLAVYTIVETTRYGWGSAHTLGAGAAALALLAAFVARQMSARTPLLPLRVFRSRNVSGANAVQALTVAAAFGFQVLIPQYMQRVLGYGPARAGLAMLPAAVVIGTLSAGASARLNARFGTRSVLIAGLVPIVAGFALLTRVPAHGGYAVHLLPTMLLIGGFGLAFPAMITLAMSGATPADAGVASGLVNTTQQVGAALGVAVLSTLAAARTAHVLAATGAAATGAGAAMRAASAAAAAHAGAASARAAAHAGIASASAAAHAGIAAPVAAALTSGYRLAFGAGTGLAAAAVVLAAAVLRSAGRPALPASPADEPQPRDSSADEPQPKEQPQDRPAGRT
ncbi:MAG: MFS transporter [Streptosporangiaceae bacterium]|nr:MFS transporter [Streptosporangiaceae bacterium]